MTREEMCTEKTATCLAASLSTNTSVTSRHLPAHQSTKEKPTTDGNHGTKHFHTQASGFDAAFYNMRRPSASPTKQPCSPCPVWKSTPSRRTNAFLQQMEQPGAAQPRIEVLVVVLKAMIKDILFSKDGDQEQPLLRFANMNRSPADKARQLPSTNIRERHEETADQRNTGRSHAADKTEKKYGQPGLRQERSEDAPGGVACEPHILFFGVDQMEDQQSHWKLKRFK